MRRLLRHLKSRWGIALQSDTAFIEAAFREILGRNPDLDGLTHYRRVLREGVGRTAVLLDLMRSDEFRAKLKPAISTLPDLKTLRPDCYSETTDRTNGEKISVFNARSQSDFDWLEDAILSHGYYNAPGVWNLEVNADKRVMAELLASFQPAHALELGCAAGGLLQCLQDVGVLAEGVEISPMAIERAPDRVRDRIHKGDLLNLHLQTKYDLLVGLDVFEHLNPNKLTQYISRLADLIAPGGFLFCNIPMFGPDSVFGTVFPCYIDEWGCNGSTATLFSILQVDELGYPVHGHLTWATPSWWVQQFEGGGFSRAVEVEKALHAKYDRYFSTRSPARQSFFVFTSRQSADRVNTLIQRIATAPSDVLARYQ